MHRVAYRVGSGSRVTLDPTEIKGKGGEAYIFKVGAHEVAKIFMEANDPAFVDKPELQRAAERRIATHQKKMRDFPFHLLPKRIVTPIDLLIDSSGRRIIGYTMEYLDRVETLFQYSDRDFRESGGISANIILDGFLDLHPTVKQTHEKARVVISDFNNLNVLLQQPAIARIVDADSMGDSNYLSNMFTAFYVDPRLCDPNLTYLTLVRPHDFLSDWYAFETMLMEAVLYTRPWGGVYKPKDPKKKVPLDARPLHGISVMHPEVVYPKPALPLKVLPDDVLHHMYQTYEEGKRGEFPIKLLDFRFGKCPNCGLEHARTKCPDCSTASTIKKLTQVRGSVRADYIFQTSGVIVSATVQDGQLKFVYHDNGRFYREDGSAVLDGDLDREIRYRIYANRTILAKNGQMYILENGQVVESQSVDSFGNLPLFDANSNHVYWAYGGYLYKNGVYGSEVVGEVLAGQTMFWVGKEFGFGFYRVGNLTRAFVFDAERSGLDDSVQIVPINGHLVDSTCVFTSSRAWFMTSEKVGSKFINRAQVISRDGRVEAVYETNAGDGSWLSKIRGKLPIGNFILSSTNDGMVRAEIDSGQIVVVKEFPDTEPYLDENSFLLPGGNGVSVIRKKEIINLTIK